MMNDIIDSFKLLMVFEPWTIRNESDMLMKNWTCGFYWISSEIKRWIIFHSSLHCFIFSSNVNHFAFSLLMNIPIYWTNTLVWCWKHGSKFEVYALGFNINEAEIIYLNLIYYINGKNEMKSIKIFWKYECYIFKNILSNFCWNNALIDCRLNRDLTMLML